VRLVYVAVEIDGAENGGKPEHLRTALLLHANDGSAGGPQRKAGRKNPRLYGDAP